MFAHVTVDALGRRDAVRTRLTGGAAHYGHLLQSLRDTNTSNAGNTCSVLARIRATSKEQVHARIIPRLGEVPGTHERTW